MKKTNFVRKALIGAAFALAAALLVPAAGSTEVQAAPKKVTAKSTWKKAPAVKANKTYKVTSKAESLEDAFVKFKAPKKGTYVITVSNYTVKGSIKAKIGGFMVYKKMGSRVNPQSFKVKTEGGKSIGMNLCTKEYTQSSVLQKENMKQKLVKRHLTKRTATVTLKKNQTIWINFLAATHNGSSFTLKIKKK